MEIILYLLLYLGLFLSILWLITLYYSFQNKKKFSKINYENISIIIPAFNEEKFIKKTIDSCLNLNYEKNIDIYIVNDGSTDDTKKICEKYKNKIILINKKNSGKPNSVNYVLKKIKTKYFCILDADSTLEKDSLKNLYKYLFIKNENNETNKIGAVISRLKPNNENIFIVKLQIILYMVVGISRYLQSELKTLYLTPGVLSLYKTNLVKKIGYFDDKNLTEDFEIAYRIRKNNHLVLFSKESKTYTNVPKTFKIFIKQQIRWTRGFIQTNIKHKECIFNKKYNFWGLYQIPISLISPILLMVAFVYISINLFIFMWEFILKLIYSKTLLFSFEFTNILDIFYSIDIFLFFLISIGILYLFFLFYFIGNFYSHSFFSKDKFKNIFILLFYILIFNYIYIYIYLISLYDELIKKKYDWGTK